MTDQLVIFGELECDVGAKLLSLLLAYFFKAVLKPFGGLPQRLRHQLLRELHQTERFC